MRDPDQEIWAGVLAHLRSEHPSLCRAWFSRLEPLGMADGTLRVRTASRLHRDYLHRECLNAFNESLQAVTGRLIGTRFLGPDEPESTAGGVRTAGRAHPAQSPVYSDGLVVNPDYGFENFVIGPGNRLAHAASLAVGATPGHAYNPLFIHGGVGLGKTHLLQAICLRIVEHTPNAEIYYTSCEGFMTQFLEAVQAGRMSGFREKFRSLDVLVVDDIHFLAKRERTQEEFFHTFNALFQANKQIILSSDAVPEEIPDLEERLVSRFKWGLVAMVEPPCFETRVAILHKKAGLHGLSIADDVACFIATRIDTNIRELEGALRTLQIRAHVEGCEIDLELAKEALGEPEPELAGGMTVQVIIDAVTAFYGVRLADLQSKRRNRSIALPRQVCMYLARRHTRHSLEEIGGYFGGRDHTTVMHALRAIQTKKDRDELLANQIDALEDRLTQRSA
ncbi:MAG: chromosomal replication initiator protein DnaA [Planctomycetes bacterium]|nr:chromosomal replication initiator protein DnaA [Planctomycetota bacterium]